MTAVNTLYGSFDENQLKSIRDALSEISNEMTIIDSHKKLLKMLSMHSMITLKFLKKFSAAWQRLITNNLSKKK